MASVAPAPNSGSGPSDPRPTQKVGPGDVVIIKGTSWISHLIELGEHIAHLPEYSHGALVDHIDANGVIWGLEGRPGGVGWAQMNPYLQLPSTLTNAAQPKTSLQRASLVRDGRKLLGTAYDWEGIVQDAERDLSPPGLKLEDLWHDASLYPWNPPTIAPAHVVCTSYLAWDYDQNGLAAPLPADPRHVEPGDWAQFIQAQGWLASPTQPGPGS